MRKELLTSKKTEYKKKNESEGEAGKEVST